MAGIEWSTEAKYFAHLFYNRMSCSRIAKA